MAVSETDRITGSYYHGLEQQRRREAAANSGNGSTHQPPPRHSVYSKLSEAEKEQIRTDRSADGFAAGGD